jgi:4-hydroxybenzoate polyprenyltransferase
MRPLSYIQLLRPLQWLKNLMLFFPPFLAGSLPQVTSLTQLLIPFAAFCSASSATYIFNDIGDISRDQAHPAKKNRPLASGVVATHNAAFIAGLLLMMALIAAALTSTRFLYYLGTYVFISVAYSLILKNYAVIDIFCISSGFLLRLLAGGEAFHVVVSEWLFVCVFLLAIFLSSGKRLAEKTLLSHDAHNHRQVLTAYPVGVLDGFLYMSGSAVLVAYAVYVINRHSLLLLYTVPLCAFGLFRYIVRIKSGKGGDPTESLTRDLPLLLIGITWAVMVALGVYS